MTRILTPDICVIGAGSGGLTVAAAAAAFGVDVVLIEKHRMGGDCLNTGCVPSKALIAAAGHVTAIREARAFGIDAGEPRVDFARVNDHVRAVIKAIEPNDSVERFEGLGVTVLRAAARFAGPDKVVAGDAEIRARRFVVATGSSAAVPPIPGLEGLPYLTNESVFDLRELPKRLIVIGGGPIGMELAQAHGRLGSQVVVLEAFTALAKDDPDLTHIALERIRRDGVEIREKVGIVRVEARGSGLAVILAGAAGEEAIEGTHLLVAAGRRPNVSDLGLDAGEIAFDDRGITVDRGLRTTNRKVYAIGDVASIEGKGGLQFTHVAGYHAGLAVRSILFRLPVRENRDIVPRVTYTDPAIGQVGLTEALARARHGDAIRVLTWPYRENDRAQAERETEGLVKVVTTARGRILGAGVVGRQAGELVNMWSLAVASGLNIRSMAGYISPYPTLAETGRRAAIGYFKPSLTSPVVRGIIRFLRRFG